MESKRKILNRHRGGEAIRSISRELNVSRNTVREIIRSDRSTVSFLCAQLTTSFITGVLH